MFARYIFRSVDTIFFLENCFNYFLLNKYVFIHNNFIVLIKISENYNILNYYIFLLCDGEMKIRWEYLK